MTRSVYVAPQNRALVENARTWLRDHDRSRSERRSEMSTFTVTELRDAAVRIAKRRHPDQGAAPLTTGFEAGAYFSYAEVRLTGGAVLILRSEAEAEAMEARKP